VYAFLTHGVNIQLDTRLDTHFTALSHDNLVKPAPEVPLRCRLNQVVDGVAVASAGPNANHLHFTPDR